MSKTVCKYIRHTFIIFIRFTRYTFITSSPFFSDSLNNFFVLVVKFSYWLFPAWYFDIYFCFIINRLSSTVTGCNWYLFRYEKYIILLFFDFLIFFLNLRNLTGKIYSRNVISTRFSFLYLLNSLQKFIFEYFPIIKVCVWLEKKS